MKLSMTILRGPAKLAGLLLALSAPATGFSAEQYAAQTRPVAPLGMRVQPVNYNCPNGDCNAGGQSWGGGGHCFGGGLFGHGCRHGSASGNAWVRPPATWGLSRTPNTYRYYWNGQLAGVPTPAGGPYPMVYQPTDTTQMGFYYQAVPRWQYRPEMLPPAPTPNWPLGMNTAYGIGGGSYSTGPVTPAPNYTPTYAQPNSTSPVTPVTPMEPEAPVVAPPPPAEPDVNVPEPEAAVFPNRRRR